MSAGIERIGVVVPAHNEDDLLGGCLEALQLAVRAVHVPTQVVVVLDDCTDDSAKICRRFGVQTCRIAARKVGEARAAGIRILLRDESRPASVWLASTDADSRVEPTWLRHQIRLAESGVDVVLGVVRLCDDGPSLELRRAFETDYDKRLATDGTHSHVHGANLGVRASAYLRAGGFPPVANHEDQWLVQRLRRLSGVTIRRCQHLDVKTSHRLDGRCEQGFAATLARLDTGFP
jgi:cellulose synthase/poly-beta-1,6-N-acetylglucosamine synthase-like glycosyltransferase